MVTLHDKESRDRLGEISDEDFQFLADALEEESTSDQDYYIDADTLDMLEEDGGSPDLIAMLRAALGTREGMDVEWSR